MYKKVQKSANFDEIPLQILEFLRVAEEKRGFFSSNSNLVLLHANRKPSKK